ncbi:hypothetical protein TNCV_1874561 [Trichonephila clavipes]|nr:hypothetical protein TNCV_1874561 [Trichonephila clavipes]
MSAKLAKTLGASLQTDDLIGTFAHAPQRPMVTYTGMGTVGPSLLGCCANEFEFNQFLILRVSSAVEKKAVLLEI